MIRNGLLLLLLSIAVPQAFGQKIRTVRLKPGTTKTVLQTIRIVAIEDSRTDTMNIGIMRAGLMNKPAPVNLEGGVATAFARYIASQISQPVAGTPLEMRINKLIINEAAGAMRERVTLRYGYSFFKGGNLALQYDGESYAETSIDASAYIGQLVRESIHQTLEKADDDWHSRVADTVQKVVVTAKVEPGNTASGNIFWSKSRPLTFTDYQGKPDDLSLGDAATFTGLTIGYSTLTEGPNIKLSCGITPIFSPARSWFRSAAKKSAILAHEQLHFDITALHACLLADKIRQTTFSAKSYKEQLEVLQAECNDLLQKMQERYDSETSHGRLAMKQALWERDIKAQLGNAGCY